MIDSRPRRPEVYAVTYRADGSHREVGSRRQRRQGDWLVKVVLNGAQLTHSIDQRLTPDSCSRLSLGSKQPNSNLGQTRKLGKVSRASAHTDAQLNIHGFLSQDPSFISNHSKNGHQLRQQLLRPHLGDHPYVPFPARSET